MMPKLHSGEILESAIRRSGMSISEVAKRMHVNRRTVYNWFQQPSLRIDIISEIGHAIGYDFSKEVSELFNDGGFAVVRNDVSEAQNKQPDSETIHYWMSKYIELLENYNQALKLPENKAADNGSA